MIIEQDIGNFYMLNWLSDYMIGHKGFICGGCFKNIFNKEKVKDLDIFFENEEDWSEAVLYYDKKTAGYGYDEEEISEEEAEYIFCYENKKVKSYKNKKSCDRLIKYFHLSILKFPTLFICFSERLNR